MHQLLMCNDDSQSAITHVGLRLIHDPRGCSGRASVRPRGSWGNGWYGWMINLPTIPS